MTIKIKHLGVIAAILIAPPLPVTFPEPVTAQIVKSDSQSQEQVRRAVINELPKFFNEPTSTPEVREITVVGNYAFVYWSLGEGGGSAIAIKKGDVWQVKLYGDDWGGIERLEKDGIPRDIAQKLLDKAFPEWRQF